MQSILNMHDIAHKVLDQWDTKQSIVEKLNALFSPLDENYHIIHYTNDGLMYSINIDRRGWLAAMLSGSKVKITVKQIKLD